MLARLALLFVVVPLIELALLIQVGQVVGLWPTIGLVVLTGAAGAALARAQGLSALYQFQQATARGELPTQAIQDGLSILVGGAFLLTPGLLTDLAGFTLLVPPTRRWIQKRVARALEKRVKDGRVRFTVVDLGGASAGGPFGWAPPGRHDEDASTVQDAQVLESRPGRTGD